MKRPFRVLSILFIAAFLASCAGPLPAATATTPDADPGPRISFASPETGIELPLEPVPVLMLSEDPLGTAQVEVLVNGATAATIPSPDTARDSVILEFLWEPSAAGKYILQAHGQNSAGTWGGFASLELTIAAAGETSEIIESPTEEKTPTETGEPTDVIIGPTATETPVLPEFTPTPTPTPQNGISIHWSFSYLRMFEYGSECEPQKNGVFVSVSGIDHAGIDSVMVFFRPKHPSTGALGKWTSGLRLELFESGIYGRGFSSAHFGTLPFVPAVILHQIVITDPSRTPIFYSEVYQEIYLGPCIT
jgi:hypothetical protein